MTSKTNSGVWDYFRVMENDVNCSGRYIRWRNQRKCRVGPVLVRAAR